jgi:hypothetical protein
VASLRQDKPIPQKNNKMILGAMMRVLNAVLGIAILACPSTNGFMVASPLLRVPLALHMTMSTRSADALYMRRNKFLPPRANPFKKLTRRRMSDAVSTAEEENNKGFWGKVSRYALRVPSSPPM